MKKERRTVVYDDDLRVEACRFEGIAQPFPNHFHEYYVIGFVEEGERCLSCKNQEYVIRRGDIVLFNPGDNHACAQSDEGTLNYQGFNITKEVMLDLAGEVTGRRELPGFSKNVIRDQEAACYFRPLHEMVMKGSREFGKEESLLLLLSMLIQQYGQPFESCIPECPGEIEKACAFMEGHYMERIYLDQIFLLEDFQPVEILFFRFVMGCLALLAVCPRGLKGTTRRQELTFAAAGLCGVCLYYLLENIALTYTLASNMGVIISAAPFFTAILSHLIMKEEKLRANFFLGFVVAMAGLFLISFNGSKLELNPMGDLPALFLFGFRLKLARFGNPVYLLNIIYLGIGVSALCFVTWNFAVKVLGAVKTSVYIYMVPVITAMTSVLILHEKITVLAGLGMGLTLAGLFLSEGKELTRKEDQHGLTK